MNCIRDVNGGRKGLEEKTYVASRASQTVENPPLPSSRISVYLSARTSPCDTDIGGRGDTGEVVAGCGLGVRGGFRVGLGLVVK